MPMFYVLDRQISGWSIGNFLIRTTVTPERLIPSVQKAIASYDPLAVVSRLTTMNALLAEERYRALLSSLFGSSALLLSAIGLYGIVARSMTDRWREFGVRAALGGYVFITWKGDHPPGMCTCIATAS
jgi:putative ABC transport system permease protein